jgi:hypothetical protein
MGPGDVEADGSARNPEMCGTEGTLVKCKDKSSNVQIR